MNEDEPTPSPTIVSRLLSWLDGLSTSKSIFVLAIAHFIMFIALVGVMVTDVGGHLTQQVIGTITIVLMGPLTFIRSAIGGFAPEYVLQACNSLTWGLVLTYLIRYRPSRLARRSSADADPGGISEVDE